MSAWLLGVGSLRGWIIVAVHVVLQLVFVFRALLRWVATDDGAPEAIQDYGTQQLAVPIAAALGQQTGMTAEVARERATLAGSQLVGLAMLRYVFRLEPVASSSVDRLVETVGPTIQHYLTGPLTSHR